MSRNPVFAHHENESTSKESSGRVGGRGVSSDGFDMTLGFLMYQRMVGHVLIDVPEVSGSSRLFHTGFAQG